MTTSKRVLWAVMIAYFIGVIEGGILVAFHPEYLEAWLVFLAAPTAVAIGFYAWKAKAENIQKFSQKVREKIENI